MTAQRGTGRGIQNCIIQMLYLMRLGPVQQDCRADFDYDLWMSSNLKICTLLFLSLPF
jgi:hypothetical protein